MNIAEIQKKLALVQSTYGSIRRAFHAPMPTMQPVLDEETLTAFEVEHRVKLPEEYRLFLLHVGNGGAGPCGLLEPLAP